MDIKPIETVYKGHRFRSRLEARWAVFFDTLGVEWTYEAEGYRLGDGTLYLPDFRLPKTGAGCFVEIKPDVELNDVERHKAVRLAVDSGDFVMVFCGNPWPSEYRILEYRRKMSLGRDQLDCLHLAIERGNEFLFRDLAFRWQQYDISEILAEGMKAFPQMGRRPLVLDVARHTVRRRPFSWCSTHSSLSFGFMFDEHRQCKHCGEVSVTEEVIPYSQCFVADALGEHGCESECDAPALTRAFEAARGARFEHGETPR